MRHPSHLYNNLLRELLPLERTLPTLIVRTLLTQYLFAYKRYLYAVRSLPPLILSFLVQGLPLTGRVITFIGPSIITLVSTLEANMKVI